MCSFLYDYVDVYTHNKALLLHRSDNLSRLYNMASVVYS